MTKDASLSLLEALVPPFLVSSSCHLLSGHWESSVTELGSSIVGSPLGSLVNSGEDKPGLLPPFPEPALDWEKLLSPGHRRPEFSACSLYRDLSRPNVSVCLCHPLSVLSVQISGHAPPTGNWPEAQASTALSNRPGPPWPDWDTREF